MTTITTRDAHATETLGATLGAYLRPGDLVVLTGDLGAGKTTFVKGVAAALGVAEPVTSPTFAIVHEYDGRVPVAHVDVYRLQRIQELHDLGFDEMLEDRVVLVEWGDAIARVLPRDRVEVTIALPDPEGEVVDERRIEIVTHGAGWSTRAAELERALSAIGAK